MVYLTVDLHGQHVYTDYVENNRTEQPRCIFLKKGAGLQEADRV